VALLVLLFVALPWLPEVTWLRTAAALAVVLCAGLVVGVAVAKRYGHRPLRFALWPLARVSAMSVERLERATLNMARGLVAMSRPRVALVAFAWTTLSWLVMALSFWLVMIALGLHLPPVAGLFVVIAVGLGMVIPSSPAALGVFEAAAVVALLPYGVGKSLALSYALAVHAVNFVLYTAGGAAILPRYAIGFRRRSRAATATPSRVARGSARQLRKLGALSAMSRRSAKVAAPVQESTT
jgi:uncharacterized protein (TIRG00374 family)